MIFSGHTGHRTLFVPKFYPATTDFHHRLVPRWRVHQVRHRGPQLPQRAARGQGRPHVEDLPEGKPKNWIEDYSIGRIK